MRDFSEELTELHRRVADARSYLRIDAAEARLTELEIEASKPDLWDDPDAARLVNTELARVKEDIDLIADLEGRCSDVETLSELGREEGDESVEPEVAAGIADLVGELDRLELRALFTGEHDERDAICEVHSGAGGTDAADWAQMLLRMYMRWGERRDFDVELDEVQQGTEAEVRGAAARIDRAGPKAVETGAAGGVCRDGQRLA
mgnify:CR=1 FL=1